MVSDSREGTEDKVATRFLIDQRHAFVQILCRMSVESIEDKLNVSLWPKTLLRRRESEHILAYMATIPPASFQSLEPFS